jgi:hypothetical protein
MSYYLWLPPWAWAVLLFLGIVAMLWLNARPAEWWGDQPDAESEHEEV